MDGTRDKEFGIRDSGLGTRGNTEPTNSRLLHGCGHWQKTRPHHCLAVRKGGRNPLVAAAHGDERHELRSARKRDLPTYRGRRGPESEERRVREEGRSR